MDSSSKNGCRRAFIIVPGVSQSESREMKNKFKLRHVNEIFNSKSNLLSLGRTRNFIVERKMFDLIMLRSYI